MPRLMFEKTGRSVWISHLDLMRLFQRAFKRAGLKLKHTQGFNPRPSVSIALPLSVGVESECELLDFDLEGEIPNNEQIKSLLNDALVDGVQVKSVYDSGKKIGQLALLSCSVTLEYDRMLQDSACDQINKLFDKEHLILPKKTKSGMQDQDIIPMIKRIYTLRVSDHIMVIDALICCQNPTLNPAQIVLAIETFLPDLRPDMVKYRRVEIYDINETEFR